VEGGSKMQKPRWFNTVESRDLIGLSLEDQRKQIEMVKELNEWNARALRIVAEREESEGAPK
jgi:hypothetical protein